MPNYPGNDCTFHQDQLTNNEVNGSIWTRLVIPRVHDQGKTRQLKIKQGDLGTTVKIGTGKVFGDDSLPRFYIRSLQTMFSFIVQYRDSSGRQQRLVIGDSKTMKLSTAREIARKRLAEVASGKDPAAIKKAARNTPTGLTFNDLIDDFMAAKGTGNRPRAEKTLRLYEAYLRGHCTPLHRLAISDVTTDHVWRTVEDVKVKVSETTSGSLLRCLSSFFSWCIAARHIPTNPASGVAPRELPAPRTRVLSDDELSAVWEATADGSEYSKIVRLLLLTGQRAGQIAGLRWDEVDLDKGIITFGAGRMKGGRQHIIPITGLVRVILESIAQRDVSAIFGKTANGFSGFSKSQGKLLAKLPGMRPWTLHDLRRSFTTGVNEIESVNPWDVETVLGHVVSGVKKHYDYSTNIAGKFNVLNKWHNHVRQITGQDRTDVIAFPTGSQPRARA
jgi:integrase